MDNILLKSVEDYLREVNYSLDTGYIPSDFALEFVNFIKLVNGVEGEENLTPVLHFKMLDQIAGKKRNICNMLFRGASKLGSKSSKILTPNGWTTMGNIQVGDELFNRYGEITTVTYKTAPMYPQMYDVTLSDGTILNVGDDHRHITTYKNRGKWVEKIRTTQEMYDTGVEFPCSKNKRKSTKDPKKVFRFKIPLIDPVKFKEKDHIIPAYTFGYGLANGSFAKSHIHTHVDDGKEIQQYIEADGFSFLSTRLTSEYGLSMKLQGHIFKAYSGLKSRTKFIPEEYKQGSIQQRIDLLRGLMDGDGSIQKNKSCRYDSFSKQLAKDVRDIVRSLGGLSHVNSRYSVEHSCEVFTVIVNSKINPFRLKRKANLWVATKKITKTIISIEPVKLVEEGYCIQVASRDHSYIMDGYTLTKNTTLLGEYLFLYIGVYGSIPGFGKVALALYVSDSIENGVKNMRKNLEFRWENSEFLQTYIPKIRFTDVRWEFRNKDGNIFIVKGFGAKSGVRGTKELGQRPVLCVLDDLVSDEDARSATVIASIEDTVYKAVDYALHPTRSKVIWSGTPFNTRDPLYKAVESGAWAVNVYSVCEQFPCAREDFKGAWEDRFDYDYVERQYNKALKVGKIDTFNQELMLRIMSEEDRLIQDTDISWYKRAHILENKGLFNFYITTDFATSEQASADFSVISVWAYNNNGDWLWVDGICKRQLMDKNINELFRLAQIYNPQQVGIEVSGQQGGFIQWIQNEMLERNIWFTLASENNSSKPGIKPNTNKMVRFNIVVPWFKMNKVFFPEERKTSPEIQECIQELSLAAASGFKSKHDDFIDTISMLSSLTPWKPSQVAPMNQGSNDEIWDLDIEEESNDLASYIV